MLVISFFLRPCLNSESSTSYLLKQISLVTQLSCIFIFVSPNFQSFSNFQKNFKNEEFYLYHSLLTRSKKKSLSANKKLKTKEIQLRYLNSLKFSITPWKHTLKSI